MALFNRSCQFALWCAYKILLVWWFVRRPNHHGSLLMIWSNDSVLLLRNSYQPLWSAPGGSVEKGESSLDAVARECLEEIGVGIVQAEVRYVGDTEILFNNRLDKISIHEWNPSIKPQVIIDHREVVEARWFSLNDVSDLPLIPHLAKYFFQLKYHSSQNDSVRNIIPPDKK